MAEIQSADQSNGQLTQRFIEFVMMQAQQAALCLGKIPHPETGNTSLHLEAAKMFIDHLELLREKTRGNLSQEESEILNGIISELQITFVEVSKNLPSHSTEAAKAGSQSGNESSVAAVASEEESKKKFSKSYGA
ncbi:MAG: DUF1844 domain-containing protein [Chthoniobacterales bacterium]